MFNIKLSKRSEGRKTVRRRGADLQTEQVRKLLSDVDQRLILMVRN